MGIINQFVNKVRPTRSGQSSASPTPKFLSRQHVALKAVGVVTLAGFLGVAAAAEQASQPASNNATGSNKASKVQLNVNGDTSSMSNDPASQQNGSSAVNSSTSTGSSTSSGNASNTSHSSVNVTVNGQNIPVPQNGSTQQTITTPSGDVSVHASSNQSGDGNSFNSTFTTTNTNNYQSDVNSVVNSESRFGD